MISFPRERRQAGTSREVLGGAIHRQRENTRLEGSDAGSIRIVGPKIDADAHGNRSPDTCSFSTGNRSRVGDGEMLQWTLDMPSAHMTHQMLGGSGPVFGQPMFLFRPRQNPNQTGTVVIEDVDEGINSQDMAHTLSGNEETRSLLTVGHDGGSREYDSFANTSS